MRHQCHMLSCPVCGGQSRVKALWRDRDTNDLIRRRVCFDCGFRFYSKQQQETPILDQRVLWGGNRQDGCVSLVEDPTAA